MCINKEFSKTTTKGVWQRDNAQWDLYKVSSSNSIKKSSTSKTQVVDFGIIQFVIHPNGEPYKENLIEIQQYNVRSRQRREFFVVEREDKSSCEEMTQTLVMDFCVYVKNRRKKVLKLSQGCITMIKKGNLQQYSSQMARKIIGSPTNEN